MGELGGEGLDGALETCVAIRTRGVRFSGARGWLGYRRKCSEGVEQRRPRHTDTDTDTDTDTHTDTDTDTDTNTHTQTHTQKHTH